MVLRDRKVYMRAYMKEYRNGRRRPRPKKVPVPPTGKPKLFYFFRSVSGFCKLGQTKNWTNRTMNYRKNYPASVQRRYFVRPVRDGRAAEKQMKRFLQANGYERMGHKNSEWFKRNKDWPLVTWL